MNATVVSLCLFLCVFCLPQAFAQNTGRIRWYHAAKDIATLLIKTEDNTDVNVSFGERTDVLELLGGPNLLVEAFDADNSSTPIANITLTGVSSTSVAELIVFYNDLGSNPSDTYRILSLGIPFFDYVAVAFPPAIRWITVMNGLDGRITRVLVTEFEDGPLNGTVFQVLRADQYIYSVNFSTYFSYENQITPGVSTQLEFLPGDVDGEGAPVHLQDLENLPTFDSPPVFNNLTAYTVMLCGYYGNTSNPTFAGRAILFTDAVSNSPTGDGGDGGDGDGSDGASVLHNWYSCVADLLALG